MANCLLSWVNHADAAATTITSTSAVVGLGPERLKDPQVRRRMRSAPGNTAPTITVNLGTYKEVGVLAVVQPDDAGAIDADGNPTGFLAASDVIRHRLDFPFLPPGTGALYDSASDFGSYTGPALSFNFAAGSYSEYQATSGIVAGYGLHAQVLPATVTPQYWQIDISAPSLAPTPGYVDLGRLWIGPAFRPTRNFAYEWTDAWDDLSTVTSVDRSGLEFVDRGPKRRVLTFALKSLTAAEAKVTVKELGRIAGTSGQVLFIQEPDGPYQGYEAILGRLVEVAPITQPNFVMYERVFQIRQSL